MENPKQKLLREKRDKEIVALYPDLTIREIAKRFNLQYTRIWQIIKKNKKVVV